MTPQWNILGSRGAKHFQRSIMAASHSKAIQEASCGRNFLLVKQCVLKTDALCDQRNAVKALQALSFPGFSI